MQLFVLNNLIIVNDLSKRFHLVLLKVATIRIDNGQQGVSTRACWVEDLQKYDILGPSVSFDNKLNKMKIDGWYTHMEQLNSQKKKRSMKSIKNTEKVKQQLPLRELNHYSIALFNSLWIHSICIHFRLHFIYILILILSRISQLLVIIQILMHIKRFPLIQESQIS